MTRTATVLAVVLVVTVPAAAQDVATCRAIQDSLQRLVCYDKLPVSGASPGPSTKSGQDRTVASFSGNGLLNTRPVTVDHPWELQWDASNFFQVFLLDKDGEFQDIIANQASAGRGSAYVPKSGTFILKFNAMGRWTAKIVRASP